MKKLLYIIFLLSFAICQAQEFFTINGVIKDASNNETLYGVTILVPNLNKGVSTNEYGFYSIKLPAGKHILSINYLGYKNELVEIVITENTTYNFSLKEITETLKEVIITEDSEKLNLKSAEMSINKLEINTIKKLPVVFGEVDIVKSLLLLPGYQMPGKVLQDLT